jgi:hypothetical protein
MPDEETPERAHEDEAEGKHGSRTRARSRR